MSIDFIRATLPRRMTVDTKCFELARHFAPTAGPDELWVLAASIQWTIESELDSMEFDKEAANG